MCGMMVGLPAGHYCLVAGELSSAQQHFLAAADAASERESAKLLAATEAIVCLLELEPAESAIPQALDVQKRYNVFEADNQSFLDR